MTRRGLLIACWGLLGLATWQSPAQAQDLQRYYYYPYHYFPHNYAPNYERWPDPRRPLQRRPAWMAYPPYLDPEFRYEYWRPMPYHKGFHFWLDQF